jgi:hypothetical protein
MAGFAFIIIDLGLNHTQVTTTSYGTVAGDTTLNHALLLLEKFLSATLASNVF